MGFKPFLFLRCKNQFLWRLHNFCAEGLIFVRYVKFVQSPKSVNFFNNEKRFYKMLVNPSVVAINVERKSGVTKSNRKCANFYHFNVKIKIT